MNEKGVSILDSCCHRAPRHWAPHILTKLHVTFPSDPFELHSISIGFPVTGDADRQDATKPLMSSDIHNCIQHNPPPLSLSQGTSRGALWSLLRVYSLHSSLLGPSVDVIPLPTFLIRLRIKQTLGLRDEYGPTGRPIHPPASMTACSDKTFGTESRRSRARYTRWSAFQPERHFPSLRTFAPFSQTHPIWLENG